ncbi:phage major capsid protein [Alkalilacustris brevis]|uniref:phage major capsid protein n=1 Tax=Alkalilacustris brevis TaxID=2026338 RepID=UPI001EE46F55|nr:phage major capsid protein [Alkalilacustris brevis]
MDRLELKAQITAQEDGAIEGVAWPYGTPDRVGDMFTKGALSAPETLPMLFGHDQGQVVGVWDQITEADEGLTVKGRLLIDDVARAREVRAMITSGAVTGLSIGFVTKAAKPLRRGRHITAADLMEVSVVAIPAHPGARITHAKSAISEFENMSEENQGQDTAEIEKKMGEIEGELKTLPKITERLDKLEAKSNRITGGGGDGEDKAAIEAKALNTFLRQGASGLDVEQKSSLNLGTNSAGGYAVAPEYSRQIIEKITEISPMRQVARVMAIGTTEVLFPVVTTKLAGTWVTETGERQESQPVFDQIKIETHEHAVIVPISQQLIEDSFIDLQAYLAGQIAEQFGLAEAQAFIAGDGDGKPFGFLDNPALFTQHDMAQDADAEAVVAAVIDLFYKLKTGYARNAAWMMNRNTMGIIRKAADTTVKGAMWSDGLADGTPPRLLGRPVVEAPDMPDLESGETPAEDTFPIALGDWNTAYTIVDRIGVQIMRDDFTGADNGIVKMRARRRVGGRLLQPEAAVLMKGPGDE